MAEQERRTKAERRAEARAERKRAEEAAARRAKQQTARNAVIAVAVVAVVALVLIPTFQSVFGSDDAQVTVSFDGALAARGDAGCEMVVDGQPLEDRTHYDPATAPPADVMYAGSPVRPTTSGPHFAQPNGAIGGIPREALDERATTHNLEHGSVIVWFDPEQVDDATQNDIESWMQDRIDLGFSFSSGGGIFASPYEGMTDDKPIAIRAWGYALDCQEWDRDVADAMIIDYFGSHGQAPERSLSPYPSDSLAYEEADKQVEDDTEAPTGDRHESEGATSSETASDAATDDASPTASES